MSNLDTSTDSEHVRFIEDLMKKLKKLENKVNDPIWILANDDYCKECQEYIEWVNELGIPNSQN